MLKQLSVIIICVLFILSFLKFSTVEVKECNSDLIKYGEYIYKREKCFSCHTLGTGVGSENMVSLDGQQGKRTNSYLYYMLTDPSSLVPGLDKPSYVHLIQKEIKGVEFKKLVRNDSISYKEKWNRSVLKAKSISQELAEEGVELSYKSEVIALIDYLQSLSPSIDKLIRNREKEVNELIIDEKWELMLTDTTSVIYAVANDTNNISDGQKIFMSKCSVCHQASGGGLIGPNLTDEYWINGGSIYEIARIIVDGKPSRGAIPWKDKLTPIEVGQLITFINSIQGTNPANGKEPQGEKH